MTINYAAFKKSFMKINASTLLLSFYTMFLVALPFTWWPANMNLVGGDDVKYEYIDPASKLSYLLSGDSVVLSINESILIHDVSGFPFHLILYTLHVTLPFLNTQQLVNAIVLAGGFLTFYWMTLTIPIIRQPQGKTTIMASFVAANVYALSTFNATTMWSHQLPVYVYIATLPLIFGFLIRSASEFSVADSIAAALIFAISPTPYGAVPWLIPMVICGIPLFLALTIYKPWDAIRTFVIFIFINIILLFPTWFVTVEFSTYTPGTFDPGAIKEAVRTFIAINKNNTLTNPIAMLPNKWLLEVNLPLFKSAPWLFTGVIYILLLSMITLLILSILVVLRHKSFMLWILFIGVLLSWLFSVILYAGGGSGFLLTLLVSGMEAIPILSMFRNNYDKFSLAITMFSSIAVYYFLVLTYTLNNQNLSAWGFKLWGYGLFLRAFKK